MRPILILRPLFFTLTGLAMTAVGCGGPPKAKPSIALSPAIAQTPSSFTMPPGTPPSVLLTGVELRTARADTPRMTNGWILLAEGRIKALGEGPVPDDIQADEVHALPGMIVTPGIIDTHSHLGVYAVPNVPAHSDGNEMTGPITAGVRAAESFWPQDPGLQRAVAGGVTTIQVLPGSANLFGGRSVTLKLHPAREVAAMRFPGAPDGLKMACGENPKRVYGGRKQAPATRMGSLFAMRTAWINARRYRHDWANWEAANPNPDEATTPPPKRDLMLETLAAVLDGDVLVHVHCYRADEMLQQLKIADEFGFKIRSFHHAVEAYKIRDVLARKEVSVSTWADWWGFKMEAHDAIEETLALLHEAGVRGIVHSDSPVGIQRLNQEAAKALASGRNAGVVVDANAALRWLTIHPAWALGIDDQVGTLDVGKMADVVVWDRDPFSVYARAERVYIDGHLRHDATKPAPPWSDFEVGRDAGWEATP